MRLAVLSNLAAIWTLAAATGCADSASSALTCYDLEPQDITLKQIGRVADLIRGRSASGPPALAFFHIVAAESTNCQEHVVATHDDVSVIAQLRPDVPIGATVAVTLTDIARTLDGRRVSGPTLLRVDPDAVPLTACGPRGGQRGVVVDEATDPAYGSAGYRSAGWSSAGMVIKVRRVAVPNQELR